jgi:hypothetical protein
MTVLLRKGLEKKQRGEERGKFKLVFGHKLKKWDVFYGDSNENEKLRDWVNGLELGLTHVERINKYGSKKQA